MVAAEPSAISGGFENLKSALSHLPIGAQDALEHRQLRAAVPEPRTPQFERTAKFENLTAIPAVGGWSGAGGRGSACGRARISQNDSCTPPDHRVDSYGCCPRHSRRPEEANLLRQPLQRVHSSVLEPEIRACYQIAYGARHKHTTGFSKIHDARGSVDGDPSDIIALQLDFARVRPCANL